MKILDLMLTLDELDAEGIYLYTTDDLGKISSEDGEALRSTIRRGLSAKVIDRIARGLYIYTRSKNKGTELLYDAAAVIKRGEYVFESLESAAAEWEMRGYGKPDALTLITTGRNGLFETDYGNIEFIHTNDSPDKIIANTVSRENNPIPISTKQFTRQCLKRHRRAKKR